MSEEKAPGRVVGKVENGVAELLFDNEARRNAISVAMSRQAADLLAGFAADPNVRLLVVRGAGDASFISGADISEFDKVRKDAEAAALHTHLSSSMYTAVREFPKPTLARIRGFCFGGGMGLAAACDLRVASDDALFSIPAARLGIANGQQVAVNGGANRIVVPAELTGDIIPGSVCYPHGWGHAGGWQRANTLGGANVNLLASDDPADWEQVSGMCMLDGIPVHIEPV